MHLSATLTSFIFLFFFQAMIQGELEVLKDWCYEAVCGHNLVLTSCFLMCWMNRNFRDSLFLLLFFVDLQPVGSSYPASQGNGTAVSLEDSWSWQCRCEHKAANMQENVLHNSFLVYINLLFFWAESFVHFGQTVHSNNSLLVYLTRLKKWDTWKGVCPLDKFKIFLHDTLLHYMTLHMMKCITWQAIVQDQWCIVLCLKSGLWHRLVIMVSLEQRHYFYFPTDRTLVFTLVCMCSFLCWRNC